jgi:hypothetical protein
VCLWSFLYVPLSLLGNNPVKKFPRQRIIVGSVFFYAFRTVSRKVGDYFFPEFFATYRKEGFVLRKFQRGLSSMETWCERWNIKINEDKTQGIYFSRCRRPPESHLTLNGRNIPFVNSVKTCLDVIFDK